MVVLAVLFSFALVACGEQEANTDNPNGEGGGTTHTHEMTHHAKVDSTCKTAGTKEYWSCAGCGKNFSDAQGNSEVTDLALPLAAHTLSKVEATCVHDGNTEHWHCSVCDKNFEDEDGKTEAKDVVIKADGTSHDWTDWVYQDDATCAKDGTKKRTCQNEGCTEAETRPLPKTEGKNPFDINVNVVRATGAALTGARGTKVVVKDIAGNVVESSSNMQTSFRVYEGEYTVTLENMPDGYATEKEFYLADKDHTDLTMAVAVSLIPASEMTDKTRLAKGSILYDMELEVIELNEADDYTTTFSELLKQYKCIYISLFFKTCGYCIEECDTLHKIYNSQSPSCNNYGDDIVFLMVGRGDETKTTIRNFKSNPYWYVSKNMQSPNLPWMTVYCPTLDRMMSTGSYPVSFFTDCEGIVIDSVSGSQPRLYYTTPLDKSIQGWQARHDRQTAENAAETATAVDALVPVQNASKTIEKAPKLLPEKKKI